MKKKVEIITKNNEEKIRTIKEALIDENKIIYSDNGLVEIIKKDNEIIVNRTINKDEKIIIKFNEKSTCKYINNNLKLNLNIKVIETIFNDEKVYLKYILENTENIEIMINIGGKYDN